MNIILLSGGSGKRLWPLSNDVRSKQFIKLFQNDNGEYESMVQRVFYQIKTIDPTANITIATSESQVPVLYNQLGNNIGISVEPYRRDTFPAIVLASAYLNNVMGVNKTETVIVCPVDPYVDQSYFSSFGELERIVKEEKSNLVLMGIEPTYPSEKYGYIIPKKRERISEVHMFKEKPTLDKAREYLCQGALWNGGVFAFQLSYILDKAHDLIDFTDYQDLFSKYESLEKISFDYAVVEHEKNIKVLRFGGEWKDVGTWNTLTEVMKDKILGEAVTDETCENIHVINELDIPVMCMGLKDIVVAASPEGILVSDKNQSSYMKPYVDKLSQRVMFADKSWGSFQIIDVEEESLTIKVTLNPGHRMNYHSHERRDEVWSIISGQGRTIVDGMEQSVSAGDVITMQAGCKHTILADTELKVIEVQLGKEISIDDKRCYKIDE